MVIANSVLISERHFMNLKCCWSIEWQMQDDIRTVLYVSAVYSTTKGNVLRLLMLYFFYIITSHLYDKFWDAGVVLTISLWAINFYNTELWWQHTEITITTFDEIRKKSFKTMKNYVKFEMQILCALLFFFSAIRWKEKRKKNIAPAKDDLNWLVVFFVRSFFQCYFVDVSQSAKNYRWEIG